MSYPSRRAHLKFQALYRIDNCPPRPTSKLARGPV